jgi:hypothetical protein
MFDQFLTIHELRSSALAHYLHWCMTGGDVGRDARGKHVDSYA